MTRGSGSARFERHRRRRHPATYGGGGGGGGGRGLGIPSRSVDGRRLGLGGRARFNLRVGSEKSGVVGGGRWDLEIELVTQQRAFWVGDWVFLVREVQVRCLEGKDQLYTYRMLSALSVNTLPKMFLPWLRSIPSVPSTPCTREQLDAQLTSATTPSL